MDFLIKLYSRNVDLVTGAVLQKLLILILHLRFEKKVYFIREITMFTEQIGKVQC